MCSCHGSWQKMGMEHPSWSCTRSTSTTRRSPLVCDTPNFLPLKHMETTARNEPGHLWQCWHTSSFAFCKMANFLYVGNQYIYAFLGRTCIAIYTNTHMYFQFPATHVGIFPSFFGGSQWNDDNLDHCVSLPKRSSQLTHRPGTPADAV